MTSIRRWSKAAKLAIVQETFEPDATVPIVALRYGVQESRLFAWRKLTAQGALTATDQEVVEARRLLRIDATKEFEAARDSMAYAFTAPRNFRYIDGPAHRKRYEKMLAILTAADEARH